MKMSRMLNRMPYENAALNWWNGKLVHAHMHKPTRLRTFSLFDFCPNRIFFLFDYKGLLPAFKNDLQVLEKNESNGFTSNNDGVDE